MIAGRKNISRVARRVSTIVLTAAGLVACLLAVSLGQPARPAGAPKSVPLTWLRTSPAISDQAISDAIAGGQAFLAGRQLTDDTVVSRSLRIVGALADDTDTDVAQDIAWLIAQQRPSGAWGFGPGHAHTAQYPDWSDLGNTQLAIAALRAAADAGSDVSEDVFARAGKYCLGSQNNDGGWGFSPPSAQPIRLRGTTHGSMTAAGLNILFDCLPAGGADDDARLPAINRGLKWLADNYDVQQVPNWQWGGDQPMVEYLWLLGRLTGRSGVRELAANSPRDDVVGQLLAMQNADGSWGGGEGSLTETTLAMAALSRARRPVLVNRLSLQADTGLDTINWIQHINATSDQPVSWQRIGMAIPPAVLAEAPILLIVAASPPNFPDPVPALLQRFLEDGGTIIVQVSARRDGSVQQIAELFDNLLPAWQAKPLAEFPAALSASETVDPATLTGAVGIGDSVRLAVVVLPSEIYEGLTAGDDDALALMTNLAVIASDASPPTGRLPYVPHLPPVQFSPAKGVPLARVKHSGGWSVCPYALARISDTLAAAISIGVSELPPEDLHNPVGKGRPILWLTGTSPIELTHTQRSNLRTYLTDGGLLFIESALGEQAVAQANVALLEDMFDAGSIRPLPDDHPLLTGQFGGGIGSDLTSVTYTDAVTSPPAGAKLQGLHIDGRLAAILSPYGVLASAEGGPVFGDKSLATGDARRLAANVLLYVLTGDE